MVQKTEKIFRDIIKDKKELWWIKLQNIHITTTPSDFIILTPYKRYLIECKEISLYKGYKSFDFSRLTQKEDMLYFINKHPDNFSYIFLNFREKRIDKSHFFLIDIKKWICIENIIGKKSINIQDCYQYFSKELLLNLNDIYNYIV